jgi:hypothetical protein
LPWPRGGSPCRRGDASNLRVFYSRGLSGRRR